jgi:hypothetical protein
VAAQIKEPRDRVEAVRPALEAMGGTIVAAGYPFGGYGAVILLEVADDTTATGIGLAIAAGGASARRQRSPGCSLARSGSSHCGRRKILNTSQPADPRQIAARSGDARWRHSKSHGARSEITSSCG